MIHYAIGGIQSRFDELTLLPVKIGFNHGTDTPWLIDDIVNRGPKSLETLKLAKEHDSSVQMVLGNHDLHLLATGRGERTFKRSDTVEPILTHPESQSLLDWLRHQPFLVRGNRHMMVHAGILPQWSVGKAESLAREAEAELRGGKYRKFFGKTYSNKPTAWTGDLIGYERLRMVVNVFTRIRALTYKGELDYEYRSTLKRMPLYLRPRFKAPNRQNLDYVTVLRHWSSLDCANTDQVIALDADALRGGELTAVNLDTSKAIQVPSLGGLDWKTVLKQFG